MATKDNTASIQLFLEGVNTLFQTLMAGYTSVAVARMKATVYASAYAAHIRSGALPEEARSLAATASQSMYNLVQG